MSPLAFFHVTQFIYTVRLCLALNGMFCTLFFAFSMQAVSFSVFVASFLAFSAYLSAAFWAFSSALHYYSSSFRCICSFLSYFHFSFINSTSFFLLLFFFYYWSADKPFLSYFLCPIHSWEDWAPGRNAHRLPAFSFTMVDLVYTAFHNVPW